MDQSGGNITITGYDSIYKALANLPEDVAKGILQTAMEDGGRVIKGAIQGRTPVGRTGNLRNSITARWKGGRPAYFSTKTGAGIQMNIGPQTGGGKKGYHAHLVEYGTKAHPIIAGMKYKTTRRGRVRIGKKPGKKVLYDKYTRKFFGTEVWVDALPHPFVGPGFQASKDRAIRTISNNLKLGIDRAFERRVRSG